MRKCRLTIVGRETVRQGDLSAVRADARRYQGALAHRPSAHHLEGPEPSRGITLEERKACFLFFGFDFSLSSLFHGVFTFFLPNMCVVLLGILMLGLDDFISSVRL